MDENSILKDDMEDEDSLACASDASATPKRTATAPAPAPPKAEGEEGEDDKLPFPTVSEMNTRLRRIITTYQRDFKKQQMKQQQQAKVGVKLNFAKYYKYVVSVVISNCCSLN